MVFDYVYYLLVILCFVAAIFVSLNIDNGRTIKFSWQKGFIALISLILIYIVATRDLSVGADTANYISIVDSKFVKFYESEYSSYFLMQIAQYIENPHIYLYLNAILFFANIFIYLSREDREANIILVFFAFMSFFFFKALAINIIRQGVAISFLLLALQTYYSKKWIRCILNIVLAIGFHSTAVIPFLLFFVARYIKSTILLFSIYFSGLLLSIIGIGLFTMLDVFKWINLDMERLQLYFTVTGNGYTIGFKPQFALFNTIFLFLALYANNIITDKQYKRHHYIGFSLYVLCSFIFFMAFQIPYSDRWGIFSWMLIPTLMIPFFKRRYAVKMIYSTLMVCFLGAFYLFFQFYNK